MKFHIESLEERIAPTRWGYYHRHSQPTNAAANTDSAAPSTNSDPVVINTDTSAANGSTGNVKVVLPPGYQSQVTPIYDSNGNKIGVNVAYQPPPDTTST
jgi:hypothetical protein